MQTLVESSARSGLKWCSLPQNWTGGSPQAQPHSWVQLVAESEEAEVEQALLLCPESEWTWVAWLPSRGETRLEVSQFCILAV